MSSINSISFTPSATENFYRGLGQLDVLIRDLKESIQKTNDRHLNIESQDEIKPLEDRLCKLDSKQKALFHLFDNLKLEFLEGTNSQYLTNGNFEVLQGLYLKTSIDELNPQLTKIFNDFSDQKAHITQTGLSLKTLQNTVEAIKRKVFLTSDESAAVDVLEAFATAGAKPLTAKKSVFCAPTQEQETSPKKPKTTPSISASQDSIATLTTQICHAFDNKAYLTYFAAKPASKQSKTIEMEFLAQYDNELGKKTWANVQKVIAAKAKTFVKGEAFSENKDDLDEKIRVEDLPPGSEHGKKRTVAAKDCPIGTFLGFYSGTIVSKKDLERYIDTQIESIRKNTSVNFTPDQDSYLCDLVSTAIQYYAFNWNDQYHIMGWRVGNALTLVKYSTSASKMPTKKEANLESVELKVGDVPLIAVFTNREVKAGEEFFLGNYQPKDYRSLMRTMKDLKTTGQELGMPHASYIE